MKNAIPSFDDCIDRLQAAAEALACEGVTADSIMAALLPVMVKTARKSSDPVHSLDSAAHVLLDSAERFSQEPR